MRLPTLCKLVHEGVNEDDRFCHANYQEGLPANQGLHHSCDGCGYEHLHARQVPICMRSIPSQLHCMQESSKE